MSTFPPSGLHELLTRLRPVPGERPNLLRVLHAVEDTCGTIDPRAIPAIAHSQGVTEADVAGVLSYYPSLRTGAPARHRVEVCLGESCLANHCDRVVRELRFRLGVSLGETTPDGRFSLDAVSCVGNCAVSPSVRIDGTLYGRVTPDDVPALLDRHP